MPSGDRASQERDAMNLLASIELLLERASDDACSATFSPATYLPSDDSFLAPEPEIEDEPEEEDVLVEEDFSIDDEVPAPDEIEETETEPLPEPELIIEPEPVAASESDSLREDDSFGSSEGDEVEGELVEEDFSIDEEAPAPDEVEETEPELIIEPEPVRRGSIIDQVTEELLAKDEERDQERFAREYEVAIAPLVQQLRDLQSRQRLPMNHPLSQQLSALIDLFVGMVADQLRTPGAPSPLLTTMPARIDGLLMGIDTMRGMPGVPASRVVAAPAVQPPEVVLQPAPVAPKPEPRPAPRPDPLPDVGSEPEPEIEKSPRRLQVEGKRIIPKIHADLERIPEGMMRDEFAGRFETILAQSDDIPDGSMNRKLRNFHAELIEFCEECGF